MKLYVYTTLNYFLNLYTVSDSTGICSFHEGGTCDEKADCVEKDEGNSFDCVCHTGYFGDGYQNGTGCTDGELKLFIH